MGGEKDLEEWGGRGGGKQGEEDEGWGGQTRHLNFCLACRSEEGKEGEEQK